MAREDWFVSFPDWREPVRLLEGRTGPTTARQLQLPAQVGISLDSGLPRGVAAALLNEHLHPRISGEPVQPADPATTKQLEFLGMIGHDRAYERTPLTKTLASAWIEQYLARLTAARLRSLMLSSGDRVVHRTTLIDPDTGEVHEWSDCYVVSSIGASGLVYFKGGNGKCGWPTNLSRAPDLGGSVTSNSPTAGEMTRSEPTAATPH